MCSIHPFLSSALYRKIAFIEQDTVELTGCLPTQFCNDLLFANSGSNSKRIKTEEIRDESGLGSGAGVTPGDQSAFDDHPDRLENDADPSGGIDDSGSTGPGSDRRGDKMPGEDGVTDVTDGIARFIDNLEDDSEKRRRNK
jgi:hypothetical protein